MNSKIATAAILATGLCLGTGCTTVGLDNPRGIVPTYEDHRQQGVAGGMSLESQDIVGMTDRMMRDMLASPVLSDRPYAPRVQIDATDFVNDSNERFNKQMITNRLRVELNRAARGRMVFVGRHAAGAVETERELKRSGVVSEGALPLARRTAGVDYKLFGEFATLDTRGLREGSRARYTQVTFEMIDMETSEIVWSGIYEFRKANQAHLIYR